MSSSYTSGHVIVKALRLVLEVILHDVVQYSGGRKRHIGHGEDVIQT